MYDITELNEKLVSDLKEIAEKLKIELKFGVGGSHKESSSSDLLGRWKQYILESI